MGVSSTGWEALEVRAAGQHSEMEGDMLAQDRTLETQCLQSTQSEEEAAVSSPSEDNSSRKGVRSAG